MESPPSFSILSEAPVLSEDSGLLITSGSFSSDSASGWHHFISELQESDYDEKSLSQCDSAETPDGLCAENFNTVKKGPGKLIITPIEPPPEFQDDPPDNPSNINKDNLCDQSVKDIVINVDSIHLCSPVLSTPECPIYNNRLWPEPLYDRRQCRGHRFTSPRLLHLSPCRGTRPSSRNSLSSRRSSSHNSLVTQLTADDSSFITQAISHDVLSSNTSDITDMYNVPFDSDIYAVPIDMVHPGQNNLKYKGKRATRYYRKRGKNFCQSVTPNFICFDRTTKSSKLSWNPSDGTDCSSKRYSLPGPSFGRKGLAEEHDKMTMKEMRKYLNTFYSSSSDSETRNNTPMTVNDNGHSNSRKESIVLNRSESCEDRKLENNNNNSKKHKRNAFVMGSKHKRNNEMVCKDMNENEKCKKAGQKQNKSNKTSPVKMLSFNLKQTFCNLFRRRSSIAESCEVESAGADKSCRDAPAQAAAVRRALPPLPQAVNMTRKEDDVITDFATSIQRVKDYGWYWGPLSVEAAEKILSSEPDGSFIVRDSSDDHYIFTLTFKLNGMRHVRIEHEQGNFCFGGCTMFKAQTIVEFIENAVETSRSGRYLFFLNLRPVLGPVRVQLLYPVSRFKRVQSLQHMSRFVILKHVRRDLVSSLPLPRRLIDYLNTTHYYSELLDS